MKSKSIIIKVGLVALDALFLALVAAGVSIYFNKSISWSLVTWLILCCVSAIYCLFRR